jgi:hypothetical protein
MSTVEPQARLAPPLVEGQRLDQATFHERYEAMPSGTHAELIGGVVYRPSPVGRDHARAHVPTIVWVNQQEHQSTRASAAQKKWEVKRSSIKRSITSQRTPCRPIQMYSMPSSSGGESLGDGREDHAVQEGAGGTSRRAAPRAEARSAVGLPHPPCLLRGDPEGSSTEHRSI